MARKDHGSTDRVKFLVRLLRQRGASDRSGEWFTKNMLKDIARRKGAEDLSVIVRRAQACEVMLKAMTNQKHSKSTHTYMIRPGELIVGVLPMGSLGFGKVFPNYLTKTEKEVAFFSSRGIDSVLAHNVPDHKRVLEGGLLQILDTCAKTSKITQGRK